MSSFYTPNPGDRVVVEDNGRTGTVDYVQAEQFSTVVYVRLDHESGPCVQLRPHNPRPLPAPDVAEGGAADARHERGFHVSAEEAHKRADVRRARGLDTADYWDAYAAEVQSWGEPRKVLVIAYGEVRVGDVILAASGPQTPDGKARDFTMLRPSPVEARDLFMYHDPRAQDGTVLVVERPPEAPEAQHVGFRMGWDRPAYRG